MSNPDAIRPRRSRLTIIGFGRWFPCPRNPARGYRNPGYPRPHVRQLPWRVYRWLARNENSFDLAIFPEWMGLAYYTLIAKSQGLACNNLVIAVYRALEKA